MQLSTFALQPARMPALIAQTFLLISIAVILGTTPSRADIVVQDAGKVPSLKAGATLPDNYVFNLQKGSDVSLLKTPSGETFQMNGPF